MSSEQSPTLRVLVIDDSMDDTLLLTRELKRGGYTPVYERVDTPEALQEALTLTWDIILSDHQMPRLSGPDALRIVRERNPGVPFIIVSGAISEDTAVEVMKAGADDYFSKDKLARLVPAVQRALRDADERRQRQQAEARFAKVFHVSPVAIAIFSLGEGRVIDSNTGFQRMFGYKARDLTGKTPGELNLLTSDRDQKTFNRLFLEKAMLRDKEMSFQAKDGRGIIALVSTERIEIGPETCILALFYDITERKQTENELRALYNATSGLFSAENLMQLSQQIVNAAVQEFGHAYCSLLLLDRDESALLHMAQGGIPHIMEERVPLDKPGLISRAARTSSPVYSPNVTLDPEYRFFYADTNSELVLPLMATRGVLGVLDFQSARFDAFKERDRRLLTAFAERATAAIETMQLYEEINHYAGELEWSVARRTAELYRAKEQVEAILNNSSDVIVLANVQGVISRVNPAFYLQFGYPDDTSFTLPFTSLIEPDSRAALETALNEVAVNFSPRRVEVLCRRGDGTTFNADVAIAPIMEYDGGELSIVYSLRDMTRQKQAEENLRRALEKEREVGELKNRFTAMVSHEFRNPLMVIQSAADLIRLYGDRLPDQGKIDQLLEIHNQVRHLTLLLEDILTLGRTGQTNPLLQRRDLDLQALLGEIVRELRLTASRHTFEMAVTGEPEVASFDEKLMRQVFSNLLTNAVKYSPEGTTVHVGLAWTPAEVTIEIRDQGIGIPPEDLGRLFEVFHRGQNVGAIPGTGLGLAIVKQAVETHGGCIDVDSEIGRGTSFRVRLPLNEPVSP